MNFFTSQHYFTLNDGEWDLFLEAYRSYEIQECRHEIYLSETKKDGDKIRESNESRIKELQNSSYQQLFSDFGANLTESIEVELDLEGRYNFFKLFDLMFTKKRSK